MKTSRIWAALAVLALAFALSTTAFSADGCSVGTLNGTYLYRVTGTVVRTGAGRALSNQAPTKSFAAVGLLKLNGDGTGTASEASSDAGVLSQRTFSVNYSVNPECAATIDLAYCSGDCSEPLSASNLAVSSDGSKALFINTVSQTMLTGELHRVPSGECSENAIAGAYTFVTDGVSLNGFGKAVVLGSTVAFASVGIEVFGEGGLGNDVITLGGIIFPRQYESQVPSLDSDCGGELRGGPINASKIFAASDGSKFVLLNWATGTVVSGWFRKQ